MSGFGGSGGNTGGNLFGNLGQNANSNSNTSSTQQPSLFGGATASSAPTTSAPSLFPSVGNNTSSNLFGGGSNNTTSSSPFASAGKSGPGNLFGGTPAAGGGGSTLGGSSNDTSSKKENPFSNMSTPNKQNDPASGSQSQGNTLFGQTASTPPTTKLFGSNNNNSTTPAGPPPANASANLFGGGAGGSSKPGNLFGSAPKSSESSAFNPTSTSGGPFNSTAQSGSGSVFNTPGPQQSSGDMFQNLNGQNKEQSNQTSTGAGTTSEGAMKQGLASSTGDSSSAPKPAFTLPSFGTNAPASQPASANATTSTSTPAASGSLFGNPTGPKDTSSSGQQPSNPFGGPSQKTDAATTQAAGPSLFPNATTTTQPPSTAAAPTASTSAPQAPGTGGQSTGADGQASTAPLGAQRTGSASATSGPGASTTGQPPSAQSRLKNKSMDDIITRWASDLTKYQKEFQRQADKIAGWDRQLVENSNAISKLYSKTWQAERDTAEIQKQLTTVEAHQDELSQWLDRYEQEVEEMMSRQVSQQDGLQGPDQERERTYKTAEGVSERLGDMGQDLTSMIEEINAASSAISKTNRADDPLSQIVRVLNGHLSQLQLIDQGTAEIQAKIATAQRESQRMGARGRNGFGFDAADEFGRSLRR